MSFVRRYFPNSITLFIILLFMLMIPCFGIAKVYASQEPQDNNPDYWIYSVDTETDDDSNKTDMTEAITDMLEEKGYCHLGPGVFYVRGGIDLPFESTVEGCGKETKIRLLSDSTYDYIFKPIRKSSIKNLTLSGGYTAPDLSDSSIGNRCGICFIANADGNEGKSDSVLPCMLDQLWIENFDGSGIYCHNTGGGSKESLIVDNCFIEQCKAGINIDYLSEYHKFSNININKCYYACINNGGNNVFSSCTFHGTIGFLIDNTDGYRRNIAHGSVVGCTFNHIDNWNNPSQLGCGDAIVINNSDYGFIFSGCQIWYGQIKISNSKGISFSDCLIGGNTPKITVTGKDAAYFSDCTFYQFPDLQVNCSTVLENCNCVLKNNKVLNPIEHTFDNGTITENPTCNNDGTIKYECINCGYIKESSIEKTSSHLLIYNKGKEPSCDEDGIEQYWTCSICGRLFADANGTEELSSPTTVKATGHKPTLIPSVSPTCTQRGLSNGISCSICNETLVEQIIIEPTSHLLIKRERIDPTCTEDGVNEYWICLLCNRLFSDQNGNIAIDAPTIIKATGHKYNNGLVTRKASTYEPGMISYTCNNNSLHEKTQIIPKLNIKIKTRKKTYTIKAKKLYRKKKIIKKPIIVTGAESSCKYSIIIKVTTSENTYYHSTSDIVKARIRIK